MCPSRSGLPAAEVIRLSDQSLRLGEHSYKKKFMDLFVETKAGKQ
jgi:hypothetical protein